MLLLGYFLEEIKRNLFAIGNKVILLLMPIEQLCWKNVLYKIALKIKKKVQVFGDLKAADRFINNILLFCISKIKAPKVNIAQKVHSD